MLLLELWSFQDTTEKVVRPRLLSGCLRRKRSKTVPVDNSLLPPVDTPNYCSISKASFACTEREPKREKEAGQEEEQAITRSSEVKELSNGRPRTTVQPVRVSRSNNHSRYRNRQSREKKATQMLAIVLGEYCCRHELYKHPWHQANISRQHQSCGHIMDSLNSNIAETICAQDSKRIKLKKAIISGWEGWYYFFSC